MSADKHRIPGDSDKHLSDWRFDEATGRVLEGERVSYTESLQPDYSNNYPQQPSAPEIGGAHYWKPHPQVPYPFLDRDDVSTLISDANAKGSADPFWVVEDGTIYIFHEIRFTTGTPTNHVTSTTTFDGTLDSIGTHHGEMFNFTERQSHPYVFKWQGTWYAVPALIDEPTGDPGTGFNIFQLDHDKLADGPTDWSWVEEPLTGAANNSFSDMVPFRFNDRHWLLVGDQNTSEGRLFYSDTYPSFTGGTWTEHPDSPFVDFATTDYGQISGRARATDDYVNFYMQNNKTGDAQVSGLSKLRITSLDTTAGSLEWGEISNQSIFTGDENDISPNTGIPHHIDPMIPAEGDRPIAIGDNLDTNSNWSLVVFAPADDYHVGVEATLASDWTFTSDGSLQQVPFDRREFAKGLEWDESSNQARVDKNGYYRVESKLTMTPSETPNGQWEGLVRVVNGNLQGDDRDWQRIPASGDTYQLYMSNITYAEVGDAIRTFTALDSTNDQTIESGSDRSWIRIEKLPW